MKGKSDVSAMFGGANADTFLGLPACHDLEELDAAIALLGVPCATPYESVGLYCAGAPKAIREVIAGYAANLQHMDFDLGGAIFPNGRITAVDCGDLGYDEKDFAANRKNIRDTVTAILNAGAVPILIGGDDSIPIPLIESYADRGSYTVVQIDAHIDWRDEVQGERFGLSSTMRRASEMVHIENIIQIGQRGIGSARPSDHDDALEWGAVFFSAQEIHRYGVEPVLACIEPASNVIIAFDCDALDPGIMPGVLGRAPGGMSYWQTIELLHGIAGRTRIAGFDLVEYVPENDVDEIGALNAARILVNVIGLLARQES